MRHGTTASRRRTGWLLRVGILGALAIAIGGLFIGPATANHNLGSYHWGVDSIPFTLKFGNNVSGHYNSLLNQVARDWRKSDVLNLKVVGGKTNPQTCRATGGRVEVCNANYGDNGWLGLAGIWRKHGHISRAVVLINDTYFDHPDFDSNVLRRRVLCHEIGHTLGLDHNRGRSCVNHRDGGLNPRLARPSRHDFEELENIYDHTHRRSTTAGLGATGDFTAAESMPTLPSANDAGQGSWIVEDLGDGGEKLTHVTWVDDVEL